MSTSTRRYPASRTGVVPPTALFDAIQSEDLDLATALINTHGDAIFTIRDKELRTPLLVACFVGSVAMVELLLEHGDTLDNNVDLDPRRRANPLMYACWGGSRQLVSHMIDQLQCCLGSIDATGNSPLLYAVYGGHLDLVRELVETRGCSLHVRNAKGHTALLQAACGGHLDVVKYLCTLGFPVNDHDIDGNTAVLFSAWGGHISVMEFLSDHQASINAANSIGLTPVLAAANNGKVEAVEWLLRHGAALSDVNRNQDSCVLLAAYGGHLELLRFLLLVGARFDVKNASGFTPLLSAASAGQLEAVKWLISHGAPIGETDNEGHDALLLACVNGRVDLVQFLLKAGCEITRRNNNGDTPLLLAAYCGHDHLIAYLLSVGASLAEVNNANMDALMSAVNGGHLHCVRFIVDLLASTTLDSRNALGYSAFLIAVQRGFLSIAQYLAAFGASIHTVTRLNRSALNLAQNDHDMTEYLQLVWHWKPIQIAVEARLLDRVHALIEAGEPVSSCEYRPSLAHLASTFYGYVGAKPVCPLVQKLVSLAMKPWSPMTHPLFPSHARTLIAAMDNVRRQIQAQRHLPYLPTEVWHHIFSFVRRDWFKPTPISTALACHPTVRQARHFWRQRTLVPLVERSITPSSPSDPYFAGPSLFRAVLMADDVDYDACDPDDDNILEPASRKHEHELEDTNDSMDSLGKRSRREIDQSIDLVSSLRTASIL